LRGRFSEATDEFVEAFTASVGFDQRLYRQDIQGSIAHAQMLQKIGVLSADEYAQISGGLTNIQAEIDAGEFNWQIALEDVHMNIESRLIALIGDTGKKLHTGRSRNDQIATDLRLWLRDTLDRIDGLLKDLQAALLARADEHSAAIMPGFTHLQTAQPVTFGHHLLAYVEMFGEILRASPPYTFGDDEGLYRRIFDLGMSNWQRSTDMQFPEDAIFVDRAFGGHFGNISRLRATGPWRDLAFQYASVPSGS